MPRRRVNINIDADLHDRAWRVLEQLPGATFSALVDDALEEMVPILEKIVAAQANEGEVAALRAVEAHIGRAVLGLTHDEEEVEDIP